MRGYMAQQEPYIDTLNHAAQYKTYDTSTCETILCIINPCITIQNHTVQYEPYVDIKSNIAKFEPRANTWNDSAQHEPQVNI